VHATDHTTLVLEGEHDLSTRGLVERAVGTAAPRLPLVVDLRAATFVDGAIATLVRTAARRFPAVRVRAVPGTVPHRVLEILEPGLLRGQEVLPGADGPSPMTNTSTTTSDSGST
jgi:hypothetical protein